MTQLSRAGPAASNPRPAPSGRRAPSRLARRPELVPVLASALAWVVLVIANGPIGHGHGAEGSHGLFTPNGIGLTAAMTIAMMGPLAVAGSAPPPSPARGGGRGGPLRSSSPRSA